MGDQKVKEWIAESLEKDPRLKNPLHTDTMRDIYEHLCKDYEEPVKMEAISISRTYKLIFADGRIEKITIGSDDRLKMQNLLFSQGINVPKNVANIKWNKDGVIFWKIDEWIKGESYRDSIIKEELIHSIKPEYWNKLGALLGEVSSCLYDEMPITVCDVHWGNFAINYKTGKVYLIDTGKLMNDPFPERWIYDFIMFSPFHRTEEVDAFSQGYASTIKNKLALSKRIMGHTKLFTERVYEKLA